MDRAALPSRSLVVGAFAGVFAWLFWPTFSWMAERFTTPDSFYSHGWLVPLGSAWLAWHRREGLAAVPRRASHWGLALLVPALGLHLLAVIWRINVVSGLAMIAAIWSLVWACWGAGVVRALRAPLLFLLFMVPLPGVLLIAISFRMKLLAASLAAQLLPLFRIPATQAGSIIQVPGLSVVVDDTCSGLRSLISLLALAMLWAALLPVRTPGWKKWLLIAAAVPVALLANVVRILVLVLISVVYGSEAAEGFIHYGSGMLVFAVALGALAWLSRRLGARTILNAECGVRSAESTPRSAERCTLTAVHAQPRASGLERARPAVCLGGALRLAAPPVLACACLLVAAALLWGARLTPPLGAVGMSLVPERLGLWTGRPLAVPDRTTDLLETEEVALMEYRMGRELPVWVAQVAGFGTRAAFHPPEICYVGSRFEVLEREPIAVIVNGRDRTLMRLVLAQEGERIEAWYWFTASGRTTPSYYQQQLWLLGDFVRRRRATGTLVRISTPVDTPDRVRRRLLAFLASWDHSVTGSSSYDS